MNDANMKDLLLRLMTADSAITVEILAAELQTEFPLEYRAFIRNFNDEYAFSGCGQRRSYINGLTALLTELVDEGKMSKLLLDGQVCWQKSHNR